MNEHHIPWPDQAVAPFTLTDENQLDRLKNQLLRQAITTARDSNSVLMLRRAANEAAALAWLEPVPLLVFPELFHERVRATRRFQSQQAQIHARTAQILFKAA